jgi:hypothetical protein
MIALLFCWSAFAVLFVMAEIMHCRKGHDVYDWTKKLAKWLDKK